ncbi:MAG: APC family permease [Levilactobacillus sp.]|jgi:amino acid transporter|uniref:APC family permease n=1 Tax=Levilactobacillus sp. TaxID=2767919 RepID=UPI002583FD5A|nr:APC family permease [Levilactobacillus sp.]MCI1553173.1 APC family permease [Levilactobacillus sp.]MCI1599267.1 APC family permease [Levilactobacillus sp.]MCI1605130.1 APC family permease [Levilactobacillus sp.]
MQNLSRHISFPRLLILGASSVIGSSWIYTNGIFFDKYGAGGEIFGFMLATLITVLASLSFAELSSIFPRSGGPVVYSYLAFGKRWGFATGWAILGAYLSALSFYVTASSMLLATLVPQISTGPGYTIAGAHVSLMELAIGVAFTLFIFALNVRGTKLTAGVQAVLFIGLVILGGLLIITGFSQGSVHNFWPAFAADSTPWANVVRFVLPAMTFLTGWEVVTILAEEAAMPPRKIGKAVVGAILLAASYYIVVLLASAWVYPWEKTATFSMGSITAFTAAGFPLLGTAAYLIAFLGLLTSFIGLFTAAPRLILSLARAGLLPPQFAKINEKHNTPVNATVLVLVFAVGFGWLGKGAMTYFLDLGGFFVAMAWAITAAALWRIRRTYPTLNGGFRLKHLWPSLLGGLLAILIAVATLYPKSPVALAWPTEYIMLAVWLGLGLLFYWLGRREHQPQDVALHHLLGKQEFTRLINVKEQEKTE